MQKTNTRKKESQISLTDYIIQKCNDLISVYNNNTNSSNTNITNISTMLINELVKVIYHYMFFHVVYIYIYIVFRPDTRKNKNSKLRYPI